MKWRPATITKTGQIRKAIRVGNVNHYTMKKYLIKGTYTADGTKGLLQEGGVGRKNAVGKMLADMGGKVEAFYFAFGEDDVILIIELPDDISAAAVALRVNAANMVRISMTVLISPEDVDEATKKTVSYRAPGAK